MIRLIVTTLVFISLCSPINAGEGTLTEGVWTGDLTYSNGMRRNADYHVTVNEDNVTEIRIVDEEQSEFTVKPVSVKNGMVSFLWEPTKKESKCTLEMHENTDYYQGECQQVLGNISVTLTMHPPEVPGESANVQEENQGGESEH